MIDIPIKCQTLLKQCFLFEFEHFGLQAAIFFLQICTANFYICKSELKVCKKTLKLCIFDILLKFT